MKIVYIAHPISGDIEGNLAKIRKIVREINMTMPDVVPLVPYYADIVSMDDNIPEERERGIKNDTAVLKSGIIMELWLFGDKISKGMQAEIVIAEKEGIPVYAQSERTKKFYADMVMDTENLRVDDFYKRLKR